MNGFSMLRVWLLSLSLCFSAVVAHAQCVPDSLVNDAPGGIFPAMLPDATGCQYYEEVISFKFPQDTTAVILGQTIVADFDYFIIDSITGLPAGMDWSCNLTPDCRYVTNKDSADLDTLGCVTLFGTPSAPATYALTVHVSTNVIALGTPTVQQATFSRSLVVTPCPFQGACYDLTLSDNCEPTTLTLTNNIPSNGNAGFSYNWSVEGPMGVLYQTLDENPFPQMLPMAGDYIINYEATIDTIGYILESARILQVACGDAFGGAPDLYWNVMDPNGVILLNTVSTPVDNATLPLDMGISNIPLITGQYRFQVWDDELIGSSEGCATGTSGSGADLFFDIPPAQTGTFNLFSGNMVIEVTIQNPVQVATCSDTITVAPLPDMPLFFRDGEPLAEDSTYFCAGGSVVLSTNSMDSLIWYQDGNVIPNATDTFLVVDDAGTYRVEAIDRQSFCLSSSATLQVDSVVVSAPVVNFDANTETYEASNPMAGFTYRWYNNDNTVVGDGTSFAPEENGVYYVTATDPETGCESAPSELLSFVSDLSIPRDIQRMVLFPNPTSEQVTLRLDLVTRTSVSVEIYDLAGRSLLQQDLGQRMGSIVEVLAIQDLAAGTYLFAVTAGDERRVERLVVR